MERVGDGEVEQGHGDPSVVSIVKVNRLRLAGHLVRMDHDPAPSDLLRNDPEDPRLVGRLKTT